MSSEQMPRIWWSPWLGRFLRQLRSAWSIGYLEVETGHYREQLPDDAVELTVAAGDGASDVRRIGEALLDVLPEVYGYRVGDEPANLDGALGRDAEKIAARLRSAGDVAADVLGRSVEWALVSDSGWVQMVPAPTREDLDRYPGDYIVRSVTRGEWVVPLDSRSPKPDPWSPEPEVRARPDRCYHGVAAGNSCPLCRVESRSEAVDR